ncbi:MAG: ABC transporter permease, partial [Mycoplasma sp.]|nr:ABC transporter permease [Mycoplasma sp.]
MIQFKVYFQKWIFSEKQGLQKFKSAVFAIVLGLSIGAILIMFKKTNPISVYKDLFQTPFTKLFRIQTMFLISTFILLSVGLGVGFYAGLFNIGGVGQMLFSFFVSYLLIHYK